MTAPRPDNEAIFHAARAIADPDRRREYVRQACGHDEARIAHVEALLAAVDDASADNLLAIDDALQRLAQEHPPCAALVKLRFFAGLTIEEAATALGISKSTADNDWAYARCWLRLEMEGPPADDRS